jgi:hypothetical protein
LVASRGGNRLKSIKADHSYYGHHQPLGPSSTSLSELYDPHDAHDRRAILPHRTSNQPPKRSLSPPQNPIKPSYHQTIKCSTEPILPRFTPDSQVLIQSLRLSALCNAQVLPHPLTFLSPPMHSAPPLSIPFLTIKTGFSLPFPFQSHQSPK